MRDPEGKRKSPSEAEMHRHLPEEARLRRRPEERADARRPERPPTPSEKRPAKRVAPRRLVAPRPSSRPSRPSRTSSSISTWVLFSILSAVATAGTGITKACKPRGTDRPIPRVEIPGSRSRPPSLTSSPSRPPRVAWRSHLPEDRPHRISGVVLFGDRTAVPHVDLALVTESGRRVPGRANEHGVFVFDDVVGDPARIEVQADLRLGAWEPAVVTAAPGTRGAEIRLDPRHTLLLEATPASWSRRSEDAFVQVATTTGHARTYGTWPARARAALVTGLEPTSFYDVLVQVPRARRAALVERVVAGLRVTVESQPSRTALGRVELPAAVSHEEVEVELVHGRLRITARVYEHDWQVDHLPDGSWWDVTARRPDGAGGWRTVRAGVTAGEDGPVVLDLR